jgi:hypothetical protein
MSEERSIQVEEEEYKRVTELVMRNQEKNVFYDNQFGLRIEHCLQGVESF